VIKVAGNDKTIYVYADWVDNSPVFMGRLFASYIRGKESFSFEYNKDWIRLNKFSFTFDPDLFLYEGRQFPPDKPLFGVFSDSSPDRWGRMLMKRKEAIIAARENRKPKTLLDSDYLLGVYDETRLGALRYSTEENGQFLSVDKEMAAPPWTTLRKLETASLAYESDVGGEEEKWLKQLLAPGSSLGGARPKASVYAPDGTLWIAKFPSKHDEWNSGAWEMVVHELAIKCGLNVPEAKLNTFSDAGSTFLVKRFDRVGKCRKHFSSAMALLGKTDGSGDDGASYLDIASFIKSNGSSPKEDLKELWSRIVFNMAVSNTDDHLRNHGFLLTEDGWVLSPMYDVNPNIYGNTLSLNVSSNDNRIDFNLIIDMAHYYELDLEEAKSILTRIVSTVSENWQQISESCELNKGEITRMKPAFEMAYKYSA